MRLKLLLKAMKAMAIATLPCWVARPALAKLLHDMHTSYKLLQARLKEGISKQASKTESN